MTDDTRAYEETLAGQLEAVMAKGDDAETKKFILDHIREFPEETQREFAVGIFEDAIERRSAEQEALMALREKAAEAIEAAETLPEESAF